MVELLIVGGLICLLAAVTGTFIALQVQYRMLSRGHDEQDAWQHAQEGHQRLWQARQSKQTQDTEHKLTTQVQEIRGEWKHWETKAEQRIDAIGQQFQTFTRRVSLEQELAHLPHVEDTPLPFNPTEQRPHPTNWRPPVLYKADLSGHDLSHRYLGRADLREARLTNANLYMADLSGASLTGADLSQANLSGANLAGADLRGANLVRANLLVADLHNAVLHSANLLDAHNLTPQQLRTAIYDSTTLLDDKIDITLSRIPRVRPTASVIPVSVLPVEAEAAEPVGSQEPAPLTPVETSVQAEPIETVTPITEPPEELLSDAPSTEPEPIAFEAEALPEEAGNAIETTLKAPVIPLPPLPESELAHSFDGEAPEATETTLKAPALSLIPEPAPISQQATENDGNNTTEADMLEVENELSSETAEEQAEETIQQPSAAREENTPFLVPLLSHNSRNDAKGAGPSTGKQGNIRSGKFGTAASRKKYSGKRQARAN